MEKFNKCILLFIALIVIFMSIGYSVLESNLKISGEVNYRPEEDIRITNFTTYNKPSEMTIEYSDFSKHEVKLGYTTTGPCSITYTVEVKNSSGVNMGILSIGGLDENVEVQSNIIGKKLVGPADTQTFTIKFNSTKEGTKTYLLTFDFKEVFTITYNSFDNIENYKKEILEGEDYTQNFGSNAPKNIEATMDGVAIENYTYSNGTLIIPNVNGNLIITGLFAPTFNDSCAVHPNPPELNGDMIPVVYDEEKEEWVKQDLDKSYDYCSQVWANAVTVKNTVKDLSGNNNDGVSYKGAIVGNGEAYLDGVDDYIDAGLTKYDFDKQITLVLRFKINRISEIMELFGNWEGAGGGLHYLNTTHAFGIGLFDETIGNYRELEIFKTAEINKYYTIVGTYDGTTYSMYLNGEKKSQNVNMEIKPSSVPIILGGNPNGSHIGNSSNITISDALIFNVGLTEEEIKEHYSSDVTLGDTKPLVYYNFEDANREYYKQADIGTTISMDDINTMWVWIPRYSYTIKGTYGKDGISPDLPGAIDIKFLEKTTTFDNGMAKYTESEPKEWRTPDAFNFGGTQQPGIWVGKFETTGNLASQDACIDETCDVRNVTIKPGVTSLRYQRISSFFYAARSMQKTYASIYGFSDNGDLHMMKNDEWGAVAYLSQSKYGKYGNNDYTGKYKEMYQNKSSSYITGSSNGTPSQSEYATEQYAYNNMTNLGEGQGQVVPGASTTGNIYGIYDMSGGSWEYVMGVLAYYEDDSPMSGNSTTFNSGFTGKVWQSDTYATFENSGKELLFPNTKYYNLYKVSTTKEGMPDATYLGNSQKACNSGICYGQALSETSGWYGDLAGFVYRGRPWSVRGGYFDYGSIAGIFYSGDDYGSAMASEGVRLVITS